MGLDERFDFKREEVVVKVKFEGQLYYFEDPREDIILNEKLLVEDAESNRDPPSIDEDEGQDKSKSMVMRKDKLENVILSVPKEKTFLISAQETMVMKNKLGPVILSQAKEERFSSAALDSTSTSSRLMKDKLGNMTLSEAKEGEFSIVSLETNFEQSLSHSGLRLDNYVAGYWEIYKFLNLLGSLFSWVSADIAAKLETLQEFLSSEKKNHYVTISSMIDYEVEQGLIENDRMNCGSRALLVLHRALEFVIEWLNEIAEVDADGRVSDVTKIAYNKTLKKHHPWLVQKGAKLAMGLLPTKAALYEKLSQAGGEQEMEEVKKNLTKATTAMNSVYLETEKLYKVKGLMEIA